MANRTPIFGSTPLERTSSSEAETILPSIGLSAKQPGTLSAQHVVMVNKFESPEVNVHVNDFIMTGILPVNVRTINGIGLKALRVSKKDGKNLR